MNASFSANIAVTMKQAPIPVPNFNGWRCKHKGEPGAHTDPPHSMPEVRPSDWQNGIDFTEQLQKLSWELMSKYNSTMTKKQWRNVYGGMVAFTNYQGFDMPNRPPRADFVNGLDLTAELPKLMKVTICGGSFFRGDVVGSSLVMKPGLHGIDPSKPLPTVQQIIEKNLFFYAVTWHDIGNGVIRHFPQGNEGVVLIPLVISQPVSYPLEWFERWNSTSLPNPLTYYL